MKDTASMNLALLFEAEDGGPMADAFNDAVTLQGAEDSTVGRVIFKVARLQLARSRSIVETIPGLYVREEIDHHRSLAYAMKLILGLPQEAGVYRRELETETTKE